MATIEQIKAARALLDWNQEDLSKASGISKNAINNLERAVATPRGKTLNRIQAALEEAGVEFIEGPGVRLRGQTFKMQMFEGRDSVFRLFTDILDTLRGAGKTEYLAAGINEREFMAQGEKRFKEVIAKFEKYGLNSKLLVKEGDTYFVEPVEHYRWVSPEVFHMVPYYVYSDKYAIVLWEAPQRVVIIQNRAVATSYRKQFYALWDKAKIPTVK